MIPPPLVRRLSVRISGVSGEPGGPLPGALPLAGRAVDPSGVWTPHTVLILLALRLAANDPETSPQRRPRHPRAGQRRRAGRPGRRAGPPDGRLLPRSHRDRPRPRRRQAGRRIGGRLRLRDADRGGSVGAVRPAGDNRREDEDSAGGGGPEGARPGAGCRRPAAGGGAAARRTIQRTGVGASAGRPCDNPRRGRPVARAAVTTTRQEFSR
jgi:hypothetical protein